MRSDLSSVMKFSNLVGNMTVPLSSLHDENIFFQTYSFDHVSKEKIQEMSDLLMANSKVNTVYDNISSRNDDLSENRGLLLTGDLSGLVRNNCDGSQIYKNVDYDAPYDPLCACFLDTGTKEVHMRCELYNKGDCGINSTAPAENCTGAVELFFFSDETGDLSSKVSCSVCDHENKTKCADFDESCVQVAFDEQEKPKECRVSKVLNGTRSYCDGCHICQTKSNSAGEQSFGVFHNCFGQPNNGCDTNTYAHLHNLKSIHSNLPAIGGEYSIICSSRNLEQQFYSQVNYNAGYDTICDCQDPASGTVICDTHDDYYHANLASIFSEIFWFNQSNGQYEKKWTMSYELSTQTIFDPDTGDAKSCSVLLSSNGGIVECLNCFICEDDSGNTGIAYSCGGMTQEGSCDTSLGRAQFNLYGSRARKPSGPRRFRHSSKRKNTAIIVGVSFGFAALVTILFLAFVLRRSLNTTQTSNTNNINDDNATVAESIAPSEAPFAPDHTMLDEDFSNPMEGAATVIHVEIEQMPVEKAVIT